MYGKQDAWILEGNSPFSLAPAEPARRAILMVHGLTDSPFAVRDLAQYFQARGFYVLAMQMPGHGTRPRDLLDFSWQDALRAHQHLLELLQARFEKVYAMGFSAGATLSIYQSMLNPVIQGLFLFSPAIKVSPRIVPRFQGQENDEALSSSRAICVGMTWSPTRWSLPRLANHATTGAAFRHVETVRVRRQRIGSPPLLFPFGTTSFKQLSGLNTNPTDLLGPAHDLSFVRPSSFATGRVASRYPERTSTS